MDNLKIVQLDNEDVLIRSSATVSDIYEWLKKDNNLDSLLSIHECSKEKQKAEENEKLLRLNRYINNLLSYIKNKINYLDSNNYIVLLREYKIQVSASELFIQEYDASFRMGINSDLDLNFIYTITLSDEIPNNLENIFNDLFQVVQEV